MEKQLLLRVSESIGLTGLGVLLLAESRSEKLESMPLHTSLSLTLRYPDGVESSVVASVEEISRPGTPEARALLLTQGGTDTVPVGTEVWWEGEITEWATQI
ncbi:hypothetical protein [Hymenobacter sediminicola]|uniref:Uncharacterized protein n=1 Tax=Hymenobacter sediminicola TaxID=2761579 RepID=A0A7G7W5D8_9BACT|nr:hypothetical protein [Hymenobacter sediminicola]QNH61581.1 hypothetical protein H4317_15670 [Hymenobacter sediminicola]